MARSRVWRLVKAFMSHTRFAVWGLEAKVCAMGPVTGDGCGRCSEPTERRRVSEFFGTRHFAEWSGNDIGRYTHWHGS